MDTLEVTFVGTFAASLESRVRAHLTVPCDVRMADESAVAALMPEVDVLVTMAFTRAMAQGARRLKLVQVPGAGLDRIGMVEARAKLIAENIHRMVRGEPPMNLIAGGGPSPAPTRA